ncbi:MAG: hypothetical protein QXF28_05585 [Nitrososphaerota archaeon]
MIRVEEPKISNWIDARKLAEKEVEKRLNGKIKDSWVDSIWLAPYSEGSKWIVKLKVVVSKGLSGKKGYSVYVKLDPLTGEVEDFQSSEQVG